jgi:hypothetical protein
MSRVELPIVALNTTTGFPVAGASVQVKYRSSGLNATWWTQETGGTSSTAAIITDAAGRTNAWLDRGAYNCVVSGSGITTYTEPWDAAPAGDNTIDSLWLPDNVILQRHLSDLSVGTAELAAGAVTGPKVGAAAIDNTHLAQAAKNLFPQWLTAANLKMRVGSTDSNNGSSWGLASSINTSIAHGLGTTPTWASVTTEVGTTTGDGEDVLLASLRSLDATNINLRLFTRSGGTANFPGFTIYWMVIG